MLFVALVHTFEMFCRGNTLRISFQLIEFESHRVCLTWLQLVSWKSVRKLGRNKYPWKDKHDQPSTSLTCNYIQHKYWVRTTSSFINTLQPPLPRLLLRVQLRPCGHVSHYSTPPPAPWCPLIPYIAKPRPKTRGPVAMKLASLWSD